MSDKQIYSATYSNVPVFEFVTPEGPIMRRKQDSWINATHILKIAKFPKAKRTRILEKDVQTGIHEKVQGGYGKYQGTYVPLNLGADLARSFGVYDELKPIFEFTYVEGKSSTPPPAPKHSHASASNIANRLNSTEAAHARKSKSTNSINEPPRKRGRPKRVTLNQAPTLKYNDTTPISVETSQPKSATRQDTEQDALNIMVNHMNNHKAQNNHLSGRHNVRDEDLELVDNSSDDLDDDNDDEFLSGRELFGTPRNSFDRFVNNHNSFLHPGRQLLHLQHIHQQNSPVIEGQYHPSLIPQHSRSNSHDPYGLSQYHHPQQNNHLQSFKDDLIYSEYFSTLLNFFLEDNVQLQSQPSSATPNGTLKNNEVKKSSKDTIIPKELLNPPQPLSKININQSIDNDGNTIFHWACSMANHTIIEFLLQTFPNIIKTTLKNNNGETPLMFLVKFENSFQLKNFPNLLDLLFDSILTVDNYNKNVLHHIALSVAPPPNFDPSYHGNEDGANILKKRERMARYYIECLFSKIIEFQEFNSGSESSKDLLRKFINHQDSDGNTAFHLVAYNLNKKIIKIFISYHKFIDFTLKNLVSYTAEEYLNSHNYVLKLENNDDDESLSSVVPSKSFNLQSFESQLYYSKMAVNLTNSTSNLITEKLTELQFLMDKELNEKDEKLLKLIKINSKFQKLKALEQILILKIFKLDYLIKDIDENIETIDLNRDKIIQDEINRFLNDLTFQVLQKREKLSKKLDLYKINYMKLFKSKVNESNDNTSGLPEDKFELAVALQKEIVKSDGLLKKFFELQPKVPNLNKDDFKENKLENTSGIASYPPDDKLHKYCKLISICCGMDINEVESSIDSIEQSLMKNMSQK